MTATAAGAVALATAPPGRWGLLEPPKTPAATRTTIAAQSKTATGARRENRPEPLIAATRRLGARAGALRATGCHTAVTGSARVAVAATAGAAVTGRAWVADRLAAGPAARGIQTEATFAAGAATIGVAAAGVAAAAAVAAAGVAGGGGAGGASAGGSGASGAGAGGSPARGRHWISSVAAGASLRSSGTSHRVVFGSAAASLG